MDYRLKWEPSDFGDLENILIFKSIHLWRPDLAFGNRKRNGLFDLASGNNASRLMIESNGYVTWLHGSVLELSCPLDMTKLPFDRQKCYLVLTTLYSSIKQLEINLKIDHLSIDNSFMPNANHSEWIIEEIGYHSSVYLRQTNLKYQYLVISITLKHEPLYFVTFVVAPFTLISMLTCSIFTLSCPSDRLVTALSLFFGASVYVITVSSNTPRSVSQIPLLGIYLLNQLGLMGLATVVAVMNNHFAQVNSRLECFGNPVKKRYSTIKKRNVKLREESLLRKFSYDELRNYDDYHRNYPQKMFSYSPTSSLENFKVKYTTDLTQPCSRRKYNRYYVTSIIDLLSILIYLTLSTWNWIYCFFVLPNK
ncbi:Acetylcholine receptor subunit gamma isoform 2 [Schistosoma japonicum]|nr:Acetylcholine receptor subunit gamma isoform 2 [Schistosoma japonicum]